EHPLYRVRAMQAQPGQVVLAGEHVVAGVTELVQQELEPQLVDLVDGDEQQLVVRRRVGDRDLLVEHLRNAQIAAVRQPPALLAEPPVPISHAADHISAGAGGASRGSWWMRTASRRRPARRR